MSDTDYQLAEERAKVEQNYLPLYQMARQGNLEKFFSGSYPVSARIEYFYHYHAYKDSTLEGLIQTLKKASEDIMVDYRENPENLEQLANSYVKNVAKYLHRSPYLLFENVALALSNKEPWIHPEISEAEHLKFFEGFTPLNPTIMQQIVSELQADQEERTRIKEWHARIDREREAARQRRQAEHAQQEARRQHNIAMRRRIEILKILLSECYIGAPQKAVEDNIVDLRAEIGQDPRYRDIFKQIVAAHQHRHQCNWRLPNEN